MKERASDSLHFGGQRFQIAAHESIIPVYELYEMCARARTILTGEHAVARVIARPFAGQRSNYIRTSRRHDFSLNPPGQTVLDIAEMHGLSVKAVGKIKDIFNGRNNRVCTYEQ